MTPDPTEPGGPVEERPDVRIPMRDGTRLAARLWLPAGAERNPVPAILEMIPYRKRDRMSLRDERMHPWFAARGYAAIRLDLRGSGDSEGLLEDEYCPQEQQDGLDAIAWAAAQPWCSGRVGMIGISWGGFNALQIAALRPPALAAIVTVGSTDDRYADDVHSMGGAQLSANFTWAHTFQTDLTLPPDPAVAGEGWRRQWLDRLERQTFLIGRWLAHPLRDAYWRHGSVCEDFAAIGCPVLAVGGWADSYTNAVDRLLAGLGDRCRALIGPWGHDYPHTALPGPRIGFLQECLRWWDRWLKGLPNGAESLPPMRVYLQHGLSCDPGHDHRPGEWLALGGGLGSASQVRRLHLTAARRLGPRPGPARALLCRSPQTLGAAAGEWCAYGQGADMPADQSADDGASLAFDGPDLEAPLEIVGTPRLRLRIVPRGRAGNLIARLCAVAPDGRSARIAWGVRNLGVSDDMARPRPLTPGAALDVVLPLSDTAVRIPPGHRLRVALSSAYWPTVWPEPDDAGFDLIAGPSRLDLPLLDRARLDPRPVAFDPPEAAAPGPRTRLAPRAFLRRNEQDFLTGTQTMTVVVDSGLERIDGIGLVHGTRCEEVYSVHPEDPASARIEARWRTVTARGGWRAETALSAVMTRCGAGHAVVCTITADENGRRLFERTFRHPEGGRAGGTAGADPSG